MVERLSTVQYGKKARMSKQLILYYIDQNKPLAGVLRIEKIAGRNILHTDLEALKKSLKKVA